MEVDGYDVTMVTYYYDSNELQEAMPNHSIPPTGEVWGWSTAFTDPEEYALGFGPGEMYDTVENNLWTVYYRYDLDYTADMVDYSVLPTKGDESFSDILDIMDAMSVSVEVE